MVIRGLFNGHPRVIQWSSEGHSMVIRGSFKGHPRVIQWSSEGHLMVIRGSSRLVLLLPLHGCFRTLTDHFRVIPRGGLFTECFVDIERVGQFCISVRLGLVASVFY